MKDLFDEYGRKVAEIDENSLNSGYSGLGDLFMFGIFGVPIAFWTLFKTMGIRNTLLMVIGTVITCILAYYLVFRYW